VNATQRPPPGPGRRGSAKSRRRRAGQVAVRKSTHARAHTHTYTSRHARTHARTQADTYGLRRGLSIPRSTDHAVRRNGGFRGPAWVLCEVAARAGTARESCESNGRAGAMHTRTPAHMRAHVHAHARTRTHTEAGTDRKGHRCTARARTRALAVHTDTRISIPN
jgi:hypothetical protein